MEWVEGFYSRTGRWWGPAESAITDRDHARVATLRRWAPGASTVVELGAGYGNTAAACAQAGVAVTAVEISERARFAEQHASAIPGDLMRVVRDDFYQVRLDGSFDVAAYWNGFGIGEDADQRRLLRRIAAEWLSPGGLALIDIANPLVWARWHGDRESKSRRPEAGYQYSVEEMIEFDPVGSRGVDTWWEAGRDDERITQTIRCYSPADLALLLEGTGLEVAALEVRGEPLVSGPSAACDALRTDAYEYLAVLRPVS